LDGNALANHGGNGDEWAGAGMNILEGGGG